MSVLSDRMKFSRDTGIKLFHQLKKLHSPGRYVGHKCTELTDIPLISAIPRLPTATYK